MGVFLHSHFCFYTETNLYMNKLLVGNQLRVIFMFRLTYDRKGITANTRGGWI